MNTLLEPVCHVCGIPADAGFFDNSRIVASPKELGAEEVLAQYQLHPNYCGALLYFAQFTDLYARDPAAVLTPGLEWEIRCNGNPREPYLRFDRIINPWGLSGFPIHLRIEEGCLTELVVRCIESPLPPPTAPTAFLSSTVTAIPRPNQVGGRLLGRFWYNPAYGGAPGSL